MFTIKLFATVLGGTGTKSWTSSSVWVQIYLSVLPPFPTGGFSSSSFFSLSLSLSSFFSLLSSTYFSVFSAGFSTGFSTSIFWAGDSSLMGSFWISSLGSYSGFGCCYDGFCYYYLASSAASRSFLRYSSRAFFSASFLAFSCCSLVKITKCLAQFSVITFSAMALSAKKSELRLRRLERSLP